MDRVLGGSETGREREKFQRRRKSGEGGRSNEAQRPKPNWFVMPDMPMTIQHGHPPAPFSSRHIIKARMYIKIQHLS